MQKIIVTGGSGFIGTNFINHQLINTSNQILNYDKLTYAGIKENHSINEKNKKYTFFRGDIVDRKMLNKVFNDFRPEILVNFAAETHVDHSIDSPNICN